MKFVLFYFYFILVLFSSLIANDRMMYLRHTSEQIIIDGIIDPAWYQADSVAGFFQLTPFSGQDPSRPTVARLLTSDNSLYCLIICYDGIDDIKQYTGKLDDFHGDFTSLMIDTFGDKRTAYKFAVNASGVRSDCRLLDDGRNRDYGWDGIWFADAHVYDWGYVVEMEIPYKSIQYQEGLSAWGLDFDRWIPASNEDIYWCRYEQNEGLRISKFGALVFDQFQPDIKGLNLELYPVALARASYEADSKYDINPDLGIDLFYNPSSKLTFQLTANPDFAQIEADPFEFNVSRYETYFEERRPFFTQGNEIFMASGKLRNSGFYSPLELFYSRRIGKRMPDGSQVPIQLGLKTFGRMNDWEYGGFLAATGETGYTDEDDLPQTEPQAYYASARIKRQIMDNSSIGILFVGKHTAENDYGVLDIDGAFRNPNWQLAYQLAHSYANGSGDFAVAAGLTMQSKKWINFVRGKYIGANFDIDQVGFVPWKGYAEFVYLTGPWWYYKEGYVREIGLYVGPILNYEKADHFTDYAGVIGFNMQFRNNWGYEINIIGGKTKEVDVKFNAYELSLSSWFNISPRWNAQFSTSYSRSYNFSREYLAFYSWVGGDFSWRMSSKLDIGTSLNTYFEGNPENEIEDVTWNARPYLSVTPVNDLNIRVYSDFLLSRSSGKLDQMIVGFLFSYNFLPKSWLHLAINDIRLRDEAHLPLKISEQAGVLKLRYLYYF